MSTRTYRIIIGVILVLVIFLALMGLGNPALWDDEAQVGFMAKTLLKTGHLTGWNGVNLYAYHNGGAVDEKYRPVNPPLDILICAGSFKLLGISDFTARLPFALLGILSLLFLYLIMEDYFPDRPELKLFIILSYCLSIIFLLNIRNARYNSLSLLFSLAILYFYLQTFRKDSIGWFFGMTITAILFFYANPMTAAAFLLALGFSHLLFYRKDWKVRQWLNIALANLLFLLGTIPYAIYYRIWNRHDHDYLYSDSIWLRHCKLFVWYLRDQNLVNAMPWMLLVVLLIILWVKRKSIQDGKILKFWGTIGVLNIFFVAIISPQPTNTLMFADVRYMLASFPFWAGLLGYLFWLIWQHYRVVSYLVMSIYIGSSGFTVLPFSVGSYVHPIDPKFRWLFPAFIKEITHPYPSAYHPVVNWINANVKPGEIVYAYPDYMNYPLMYYVGDRVQFGCTLNQYTHLDLNKVHELSPYLQMEKTRPDWFIAFGIQDDTYSLMDLFTQPRSTDPPGSIYQYEQVTIYDVFWDQTQRPELFWHSFGPHSTSNNFANMVWVYKKNMNTYTH